MDLSIGGCANYFCVVIIIVKHRISWPKKPKTLFYLLSYFSPILPSPDHMHHKCPLAWGFTSKILWIHCWTTSLWVLLYSCSTQCWCHKVSLLVALPKRGELYLPNILLSSRLKYEHIYTYNSSEHQFNFSAHFHSSFLR